LGTDDFYPRRFSAFFQLIGAASVAVVMIAPALADSISPLVPVAWLRVHLTDPDLVVL